MGLSDLDGFLTGIVVGPELILPSEWLPVIWGGDSPEFKNAREAHSVTSAIMERYNELVWGFQKNPPSFDPVFWETKDGLVIAADWAEGFYDALNLRPKAWDVLFEDQTGLRLMEPIIILCGKQKPASDLSPSIESELMRGAAEQLSAAVIAIHQFWLSECKAQIIFNCATFPSFGVEMRLEDLHRSSHYQFRRWTRQSQGLSKSQDRSLLSLMPAIYLLPLQKHSCDAVLQYCRGVPRSVNAPA